MKTLDSPFNRLIIYLNYNAFFIIMQSQIKMLINTFSMNVLHLQVESKVPPYLQKLFYANNNNKDFNYK